MTTVADRNEARLIRLYDRFIAANNLEMMSADELLHEQADWETPQSKWLQRFIEVWETHVHGKYDYYDYLADYRRDNPI